MYVTPAFPKLVYVLDENNCLKGGKYDYLTHLAVKCSAKRMYPDYISAKEMRKNYEGNVFSPMGCRSFLSHLKMKMVIISLKDVSTKVLSLLTYHKLLLWLRKTRKNSGVY